MADYIERDAAIEAVDKRIEELRTHEAFGRKTQGEIIDLSGVKTYLSALPAADVKPVVHGRWVYNERTCREECSVCGIHNISAFRDFCPNCGADMRENEEV